MSGAKTDKPDGKHWRAVACAVAALIVVISVCLRPTPTQTAIEQLRIGMTQEEVAKALSPEITYRPRTVFWDGRGFAVMFPNGFRMTFKDERLTGWGITGSQLR
jgi:hypothetical protein